LIEDYEWLLFEILTKLTLRIQSVENATLFSKIIIVIFLFFKNCVSGMWINKIKAGGWDREL